MSLPRKIFLFWLTVMVIAMILWQVANKSDQKQQPHQSEAGHP